MEKEVDIRERITWGRSTMEAYVKRRYGKAFIANARQRLCSKCKRVYCIWLPITTDGEDCPYFEQREEKK